MLGHSSVRVFINSVHYNFDTPVACVSTTALSLIVWYDKS